MTIFLLVIFAIYLLILLGIAWISTHPFRTPIYLGPAQLQLPTEIVKVPSEQGYLPGWWCPHPEPKGAILYLHGYVMNRSELIPTAHYLYQMGYSALLIDLRAHGRAPGKLCTLGVKESHDAAAALRWIREQHEGPVYGIGSSMGAASLALALSREPELADAAVLDSCYSSLVSASVGWWSFLGGPVLRFFLAPTYILGGIFAGIKPHKIDLAREIPKIGEKPLLFLHGTIDPLATLDQAKRNVDAALRPTFVVFEGCSHSDFRWNQAEKYYQALKDFLNSLPGFEEVEEKRGGSPTK